MNTPFKKLVAVLTSIGLEISTEKYKTQSYAYDILDLCQKSINRSCSVYHRSAHVRYSD